MTANQIEYAKHLETQKHNRITESQGERDVRSRERTADAAVSQAATASSRQKEEGRHNRETEMINWFSANQTAQYQDRAGRAALIQAAASSTQATAALRQAGAAESQAATRQYEAETGRIQTRNARVSTIGQFMETSRHNRAEERIDQQRADAALQTAGASVIQAETSQSESQSRKFNNYASGVGSVGRGLSGLSQMAKTITEGISFNGLRQLTMKGW